MSLLHFRPALKHNEEKMDSSLMDSLEYNIPVVQGGENNCCYLQVEMRKGIRLKAASVKIGLQQK